MKFSGERVIEYEVCIWNFYLNISEIFIFLRRKEMYMIKKVYCSSRKVILINVIFS